MCACPAARRTAAVRSAVADASPECVAPKRKSPAARRPVASLTAVKPHAGDAQRFVSLLSVDALQ